MKQQAIRFLAAAPEAAADKISAILSAIGLEPELLAHSGEEAIAAAGVNAARSGQTGKMMCFKRESDHPYTVSFTTELGL